MLVISLVSASGLGGSVLGVVWIRIRQRAPATAPPTEIPSSEEGEEDGVASSVVSVMPRQEDKEEGEDVSLEEIVVHTC